MPTYERCPKAVNKMAEELMKEWDGHKLLLQSGATVDYLFALPDYDDHGEPKNDAITHNGRKALGLARKISLKDRAKGMADAEILLDKHEWERMPEEQQRALLAHELFHLVPKVDKRGLVTDDLGRPVITMRKHDVEVGFFKAIAEHYGEHSQERIQSAAIMEECGQLFWPGIAPADKITITAGDKSVTTTPGAMRKLAEKMSNQARA